MEIKTGIGLDNTFFGMTRDAVKNVLGEPDKTAEIEIYEGIAEWLVFYYNSQLLEIKFQLDTLNDWTLQSIVTHNPKATMFEQEVMGKSKNEILGLLKLNGCNPIAQNEYNHKYTETIFCKDIRSTFTFEFDRLTNIEFSPLYESPDKVYRCYVEKRQGFDAAAQAVQSELSEVLRLPNIKVRLFNRYDTQNIADDEWADIINTVLSEPPVDVYYEETLPPLPDETRLFYIEPLPGQFNARTDSCEQCIQMLLGGHRPVVKSALVYAISGVYGTDFERVKSYLINPLEYRESKADKPESLLKTEYAQNENIPIVDGFIHMSEDELEALRLRLGLAMSLPDLSAIQSYFASENRDPTLTELRVTDTYWSDHCRHTTFNTIIKNADIHDERVKKAYELFLSVNGDRPVTLMNIATAAMRSFSRHGALPMLDISDENNACTLRIKANFPQGEEDWLLFFKNETHNHPTEIEPFGGASTCIGGAIRDPLSGRAYVYQSMRITGAADPRKPIEDTIPGKLPQRKLTLAAAEGFSSYGNQIGLATGFVREIYHEKYAAKRLETGAVVGAAPLSSMYRANPEAGDVVVLLGGRTGRDGIGGATGSSKTHHMETVSECASEVQKGNAPEERKLQRLFRVPEVTKLIKRCNDFGAGGAAVAIGELADGLEINLDAFPVKYEGLNGTELAISESQERMAVVVSLHDLQALLKHAESENIESSVVARITKQKRLVMMWRGQKIVDIDRAFLDTNGAVRYADAHVAKSSRVSDAYAPKEAWQEGKPFAERLHWLAGNLNFCSQKGLVERFDNTIGAASVFMPHGGERASTETQVMAALLPKKDAKTASVMAYGFDPAFTDADPFGGSVYAVVNSVAKLVAAGVRLDTIHLSLQEYFARVNDDPQRWGKPFAAMLGAFSAQMSLGIAAIGGKDSMSGSFGELDVPNTLISFAVGINDAARLISPEFKGAGHPVYVMCTAFDAYWMPEYNGLLRNWKTFERLCHAGKILSAWACESDGVYGGIMKMAFGNNIGFSFNKDIFFAAGGSIIFEMNNDDINWYAISEAWRTGEEIDWNAASGNETYDDANDSNSACYTLLGYTQDAPVLEYGGTSVSLEELRETWEKPLESIFPVKAAQSGTAPLIAEKMPVPSGNGQTLIVGKGISASENGKTLIASKDISSFGNSQTLITNNGISTIASGVAFAKPKAVIPVFPGTNCEYDTAAAIERAGGICETVLVRNLTPETLSSSVTELEKAIKSAQMLIFPGGFSGGDEPDGAGKFIVSLFHNPRLTEAVHELLKINDGLILGICNGFQALVKLGLLPYGEIRPQTADSPTLTFNRIGRHQSRYVNTSVSSVLSPWLSKCALGDVYAQPVSHGEGRFTASSPILDGLKSNGQIAFQYVDFTGTPSMDIAYNPNGSDFAIEGISSPDGRILGKMAHTERYGEYTAKNIPGNKFMPLFEGGVWYFK